MERLLGCPISDRLLERWSGYLVHQREPVYLSAEARRLLPPEAPVLTRQQFREQPACTLEMLDSYHHFIIPEKAGHIALMSPRDWQALAPGLRSSLRRLQWELGRGQLYDEPLMRELLTPEEQTLAAPNLFPTPEGMKLALTHDLWCALSAATRRAWLLHYVSWRNQECRPVELSADAWERITEQVGPSVRRLAFTFAQKAGPNCLATAIAGLMPDPAMAENVADIWLYEEPFRKRLAARGLIHPQPLPDDPPAGSVLTFSDAAGRIQHSCCLLGDGLVLNKQSQSWYAPRLIWRLEDLLACWAEDGYSLQLYTRTV